MIILATLIDLLILVLVVQAVLTWIPYNPDSPIYAVQSALTRFVNPIYAPVRRVIPPIGGRVDVTPMLVIIVLFIVRGAL